MKLTRRQKRFHLARPVNSVDRLAIPGLLRLLGVQQASYSVVEDRFARNGSGVRRIRTRRAGKLYCENDLRLARDHWKRLLAEVHPDRGGDTSCAAMLNAAWDRLQKLFKAKGITLAA